MRTLALLVAIVSVAAGCARHEAPSSSSSQRVDSLVPTEEEFNAYINWQRELMTRVNKNVAELNEASNRSTQEITAIAERQRDETATGAWSMFPVAMTLRCKVRGASTATRSLTSFSRMSTTLPSDFDE